MKKTLALILAVLLLACLPVLALADTMYVETPNGGSVNLRSGPSSDDDVMTSVGYGEPVEVIDVMAGSSWANVSYNGYYGFISLRYLSEYPPMPNPTFWPTFVPAPTQAPTRRPNPTANPSGDAVERALSQMFAGFQAANYTALVVPSTPTTYVNMRWAPSKSAPVRAQYWANSTLQVLGGNGSWFEVLDTVTNTHGFMMAGFLTPASIVVGGGADS